MYLIEYLDKVIRALVLIMPKMRGYARTSVEDKDKNNKLMSFSVDDGKPLERWKAIRKM